MTDEWVEWHRRYDSDPMLIGRLRVVRNRIREALDRAPPGPIPVVSLCAGDGRDLLGALADHLRAADVRARLVELSAELCAAGREHAIQAGLRHVEFVEPDAGAPGAYAGAVPAQLVLAGGVFGNVSDRDLRSMVDRLPELCARNATVVWTRGRFEPDLTPAIRGWFADAGFEQLAFDTVPHTTASVGTHRLVASPRWYRPEVRRFTFLPEAERPSTLARLRSERRGPTDRP
ncbi:MAG: SAM-dependent methyltransferase [Thermoplasmata archaeon]